MWILLIFQILFLNIYDTVQDIYNTHLEARLARNALQKFKILKNMNIGNVFYRGFVKHTAK